jgi:hypothetical protein
VSGRYDYDPDFARAAPADTPPGAEARLGDYRDALEQAGKDLAEAADAETDAELARDAQRDRLLLSPDCPKCGTFEHVRVTVAERDAWVNSQIVDLEREYRHKKRARERAEGRLRILERQGGIQQSITASVREAYRGTNGRQW